MATIELGRTYKDKITGFSGVAVGYCRYITGCNQVLLSPPLKEDGTYRDGHWVDEQRLDDVGAPKIELDNGKTPGFDRPAPII